MKPLPSIAAAACLVVCALARPAIATAQTSRESAKPESLFNGKDLDGWTLRESAAKTAWNVTTGVALGKNDKGELV
ncbi:MAG: hypothetical protein HZB38_02335 [Planctomycetes bacterium]|nr:hypothetical protein [Planctomycetota bacterium]